MSKSSDKLRMTRGMRLVRDRMAIGEIKSGAMIGETAEKYGMSRMQFWRRRKAFENENPSERN